MVAVAEIEMLVFNCCMFWGDWTAATQALSAGDVARFSNEESA
jgi:hypothetical protein